MGGKNFDYNIAKHLAQEFDNLHSRKGKPKIATQPKFIEKILPYALKYKELLSAGKFCMVSILNLDSGENFNTKLSRDEFEEFSKDELDRIYAPIERALQSANMTIDDLTWVEIVGGTVRVPGVQNILREKLENKLGVHMNGDDSVAFGAAFIAANYSSSFRLAQKIELYHGTNYEILLKLRNDQNSTQSLCADDHEDLAMDCMRRLNKSASLYKVRHTLETAKTVTMRHDGNFEVFLYERFPGEEAKLLTKYELMDVQDSLQALKDDGVNDKPKVHLRFKLNKKGLVSLAVLYFLIYLHRLI